MKKTFGKLQLGKHFKTGAPGYFLSDVPAHIRIKLKAVFESLDKSETDSFYFQDTPEVCKDLLWFCDRFPMETDESITNKLKDGAQRFDAYVKDVLEILSSDYKPPSEVSFLPGKKARDYQEVVPPLFDRVENLLLADHVGVGKTVSALACIISEKKFPVLLVLPKNLVSQWERRIDEFTGLSRYTISKGPRTKGVSRQLPPADIYITKYNMVSKWIDILIELEIKMVVLDEVQDVRHADSQKSIATKKIANLVNHNLGLSATPIYNYGDEIYNIYSVIDPSVFGPRDLFLREYSTGYGRLKDPKALGDYLRSTGKYLARSKQDIGMELPKLTRFTHTVGFDQKEIDKMEAKARILAIQALQGDFIERGHASRELSVMVRKATGISKARDVAEYVKTIAGNGHKVLLMGHHREVYKIWLEELRELNPVMYTGTESDKERELSQEKFLHGDSMVMIMGIRVGSAGLDGLQENCSYIVFGELDYSDKRHEQAIGRLDRDGQKNPVTAIFLISDSGSDPIVCDIIGLKKSEQDAIFDPDGDKSRVFETDDSVIKEFARRLVEKGTLK